MRVFDREKAIQAVMGVLMVNDPPPTGYRHTAETILDRLVALPVTDDMVEQVAEAIKATFEFNGWPGTRLPGTESVDCGEVARVALGAVVSGLTSDDAPPPASACAKDA